MKAAVKHDFFDKEHNLKLRKRGEELNLSENRASYLTRMGLVTVIEEQKGGDPVSPGETQG